MYQILAELLRSRNNMGSINGGGLSQTVSLPRPKTKKKNKIKQQIYRALSTMKHMGSLIERYVQIEDL